MTAVCGFCSVLAPSYWWMLIARFVSGFAVSAAPAAFTWMLEVGGWVWERLYEGDKQEGQVHAHFDPHINTSCQNKGERSTSSVRT